MIKANAGAISPSAREKRLLLQLAYRAAWGHTAPTFAGLLGIEVEEKAVFQPISPRMARMPSGRGRIERRARWGELVVTPSSR
jgi:hypothetical protein